MTQTAVASRQVAIRHLDGSGVDFAARLHRQALPHGLFPRLGHAFLRVYHHAFCRSPHAIALVAEVNGRPAGFLVGTVRQREHYRWLLADSGGRLLGRAVLGVLRRPPLAWRILRTRASRYLAALARLGRTGSPQASRASGRAGVLTHVAVSTDARGGGVGAQLVDAFLREAGAHGIAVARLTTLSGPEGAGDFYRRLGWDRVAERSDWDGQPIEVYTYRIAGHS